MAAVLATEDLHRRLALRQRGDQISLQRCQVVGEAAAADGTPTADAGVDDDPVCSSDLGCAIGEYLEHLGMVVHVQLAHHNAAFGMPGKQFVAQRLQLLTAPGAQRPIVATLGIGARHACAQPRASTGDEDVLAHCLPPMLASRALRTAVPKIGKPPPKLQRPPCLSAPPPSSAPESWEPRKRAT